MAHKIIWTSLNAEFDEMMVKKNEEDEDDTFDDDDSKFHPMMELPVKQLAQTPIGLVAIDSSMSPFRHYDFWQMDTTKKITHELAKQIEDTPGCEILKIISPYKAVIAPGKAFKFRDVRTAIEKLIINKKEIVEPTVNEQVNRLRLKLKDYTQWSIYVLPNGGIDYIFLNEDKSNQEQFENFSKLHKDAEKISQGILITSEDTDE